MLLTIAAQTGGAAEKNVNDHDKAQPRFSQIPSLSAGIDFHLISADIKTKGLY